MAPVTIVMPYYENPKMLRLQLHEWRMFRPAENMVLQAIVVDDGSPRNPAEPVIREYGNVGFQIRLFRIVPNIPWNQDGARNLAMMHVNTEWALLTDMDHMLSRLEVGKMLDFVSHKAVQGCYYMPDRVDWDGKQNHPHANSYIMRKDDFWTMGGYDEDFAGAYGSDGNFRKCMRAGLKELPTHDFKLTRWGSDQISDANTKDWGRKESPFHRSQFPKIEAKAKGPAYKAKNHIRFEYYQVVV
jgi:glycosyltransferase involved in cell wall biosynthesis